MIIKNFGKQFQVALVNITDNEMFFGLIWVSPKFNQINILWRILITLMHNTRHAH
jgi:hypothetical protein